MFRLLVVLVILLPADIVFSQRDLDITDYLVMIEKGMGSDVKEMLPAIESKYPASPSVMYLKAVLNENGGIAAELYKTVVQSYPECPYADASAFRLYSYYSALEMQDAASEYSDILRNDYPHSPYVKMLPSYSGPAVDKDAGYLYTIQAGAFASNSNAENLRRKFEKAGYYTLVKDKVVGGSVLKIVYTGRFKTRREAESFQVVLNRNYGIKGIVASYQE